MADGLKMQPREVDPKVISSIEGMTTVEIVRAVPKHTIVAMVMQLTGGSANPTVVEHYVDRIKTDGCWIKS